jgi:sugar phosphate isomerase/epimerase
MLGDDWQGSVDDILDAVATAGYSGIEIASPMLREYRERPAEFGRAAADRGLEVASVAHSAASGWTVAAESGREFELAREMIEWTRAAGCSLLGLGGPSSGDPERDRREKLHLACRIYDKIGRVALDQGVRVHLHPHSHSGSIVETAGEYEQLLEETSPEVTWFGPDVGHMIRGGVDYLTILQHHADRLLHLHLKDVGADGSWAPIGSGTCDVVSLVELLRKLGFNGWLIAEEESDAARGDQLAAIRHNRDYLRGLDL